MTNNSQARYDAVISELESLHATTGKMFGMPCLKIGSKAFAGLWNDSMVFKLQGEEHAAALALPGAELFDPSGRGHAMKEWVVVPAQHADRWVELGHQALQYVAEKR